jgi:hypothetical protein
MNLRELINKLEEIIRCGIPETAVVLAYDGDSEGLEPVTGFLYDAANVEICTDEN